MSVWSRRMIFAQGLTVEHAARKAHQGKVEDVGAHLEVGDAVGAIGGKGALEDKTVGTGATRQYIVALVAAQIVVARTAVEAVTALRSVQEIVARIARTRNAVSHPLPL